VNPGATTNGVVTTLAGIANVAGSMDGTGSASEFYMPQGIAVDNTGNTLYIADTGNQTIRVLKLTWTNGIPVATVSTLAGIVGTKGTIDGAGSTAQFDNPAGLTLDLTGTNLYVADTSGEVIRKVAVATGQVTTIAGIPSSPDIPTAPAPAPVSTGRTA